MVRWLVLSSLVVAASAGLADPLPAAPAGRARASAALLLGDTEVARFAEVSSAGAEIEVLPETLPDDAVVRKRPGKVKYSNITLKRGFVTDPALWTWFDDALGGVVARKSGSIIYLDREGNEVLRLNFFEAWPAAFEAGPVPGPDGRTVLESFTLGAEAVERVAPDAGAGGAAPARGFRVEIDGVPTGGVAATSRFGAEVSPAPDGLSFLVDAGRLTLTLTRGADPALHQWFREVSKGKDIRKSISVVLVATRTAPERRYTFHEAWPCRWKAPELNSASDTFIVEELEFAVERVERG